jgi:hypothetical protein
MTIKGSLRFGGPFAWSIARNATDGFPAIRESCAQAFHKKFQEFSRLKFILRICGAGIESRHFISLF